MTKKNVLPRHAIKTAESKESKAGAGLDAEGIEYKGTDAESKAAFIAQGEKVAKGPRKSAKEVAAEIAARKNEKKTN